MVYINQFFKGNYFAKIDIPMVYKPILYQNRIQMVYQDIKTDVLSSTVNQFFTKVDIPMVYKPILYQFINSNCLP